MRRSDDEIEEVDVRKVLIPVDGSPQSARAVETMLDFVQYEQIGQVCLLNVQPDLRPGYRSLSALEIDKLTQQQGERALYDAVRRVEAAGLPFDTRIETGAPAPTIARVAEEIGADQIFMGSQGHGAIAAFVLGSVAVKTLSLTTLPVTLVR
ncbi:universal stress protein [Chitiniphilus shinanonensis]|uniref:Universal stress protein n=1 Tax=Chitiniphilus shinanonensis TaxID=553088 RepID=A0ABQ6BN37_9NEIS|nr:universal stress protein [Chitiniphilus shinanonensis]GLS03328.1 universal stress protein [Chitiniphilus shinanonensis]